MVTDDRLDSAHAGASVLAMALIGDFHAMHQAAQMADDPRIAFQYAVHFAARIINQSSDAHRGRKCVSDILIQLASGDVA